MALLIEAARWVPWRWQVAEKDFNRVTDFTSVGFVLVIIYQFDTHAFHAIYAILELLPVVLFVLMAVQLYSTGGRGQVDHLVSERASGGGARTLA